MMLQISRCYSKPIKTQAAALTLCLFAQTGIAYAQTSSSSQSKGCLTINGQLFCSVTSIPNAQPPAVMSPTPQMSIQPQSELQVQQPMQMQDQQQAQQQAMITSTVNAEMQALAEARAASEKVVQIRSSVRKAKAQVEIANTSLDAAEKMLQQLNTQLEILSQQLASFQNKVSTATDSVRAQLQSQLTQLTSKFEEAQGLRDAVKEQVRQLRAQTKTTQDAFVNITPNLGAALQSELQAKQKASDASVAKRQAWTALQQNVINTAADVAPNVEP